MTMTMTYTSTTGAFHTYQLLIALHVAPRDNHNCRPTAHFPCPQHLCIFARQRQCFARRLDQAPDTWQRCSRHTDLHPVHSKSVRCKNQHNTQPTQIAVTNLRSLFEHRIRLLLEFGHALAIEIHHAEQILGSKAPIRRGNVIPTDNMRNANFE